MSAAKLEKKIWNLEQRLRDEFRAELRKALDKCASKVQELETEVGVEKFQKAEGKCFKMLLLATNLLAQSIRRCSC